MAVPYSNMNSTNLLASARANFRASRYQNVARALRILKARSSNLTNLQRIQLRNLANRASKVY